MAIQTVREFHRIGGAEIKPGFWRLTAIAAFVAIAVLTVSLMLSGVMVHYQSAGARDTRTQAAYETYGACREGVASVEGLTDDDGRELCNEFSAMVIRRLIEKESGAR